MLAPVLNASHTQATRWPTTWGGRHRPARSCWSLTQNRTARRRCGRLRLRLNSPMEQRQRGTSSELIHATKKPSRNQTWGDLRSAVSAGSGDPRRALPCFGGVWRPAPSAAIVLLGLRSSDTEHRSLPGRFHVRTHVIPHRQHDVTRTFSSSHTPPTVLAHQAVARPF